MQLLQPSLSSEIFAARKVAMYDIIALGMRPPAELPVECFVTEAYPTVVRRISDALKTIYLRGHTRELGGNEQVQLRELTDYLGAALTNSTPVLTRPRLGREWLSTRLPYHFVALLCSPTEALLHTYGHRQGATRGAEDIVAILEARSATDAAAREFTRNHLPVSLPTDFEHIHRACIYTYHTTAHQTCRCGYWCRSSGDTHACRACVWCRDHRDHC